MNVQELIDELNKIADKTIIARVWDDEYGDSSDVTKLEVYETEVIII
jgi:hypothetical protein